VHRLRRHAVDARCGWAIGVHCKADAEPHAVADGEPHAVADAEPHAVADAEPHSEPHTVADAEPHAVADAEPHGEPHTVAVAEPHAVTDAEPHGEPHAVADGNADGSADTVANAGMRQGQLSHRRCRLRSLRCGALQRQHERSIVRAVRGRPLRCDRRFGVHGLPSEQVRARRGCSRLGSERVCRVRGGQIPRPGFAQAG
jgi:hypothetical protein